MLQRQTDLGRVRDECLVLLHSRRRSLARPHCWQLVQQQPADRERLCVDGGLVHGTAWPGATAWQLALPLQLLSGSIRRPQRLTANHRCSA